MNKFFLRLAALLSVTISMSVFASGQGIITGTITGTIDDSTGAAVPGASVSATNTASGVTTKAVANGKGDFDIPAAAIGFYKIEIVMPGFEPLTLDNVQVTAGNVTGLGTEKLKVGNAAETIEVSTSQNLLETSQSQLTTTFDPEQIQDLPTGGRLDALALLIPGVVRTLGNNFANTNGTGLSSNGLRGRSNNFEIDGQSNNDNSVSGPQFFFRNEDALGQLQIITNNFSAQYGRNAGSVVNYITKSGTNAIHGTAFETYFGSWGSSLLPSQKDPLFGFCAPGQTTGCTTVA